jgi:hypothetical protein
MMGKGLQIGFKEKGKEGYSKQVLSGNGGFFRMKGRKTG